MYNDDCESINVDRQWGEELGIEDWRKMPRFCRREDTGDWKNPRPYKCSLDISLEELQGREDLNCEGCPYYKKVGIPTQED